MQKAYKPNNVQFILEKEFRKTAFHTNRTIKFIPEIISLQGAIYAFTKKYT